MRATICSINFASNATILLCATTSAAFTNATGRLRSSSNVPRTAMRSSRTWPASTLTLSCLCRSIPMVGPSPRAFASTPKPSLASGYIYQLMCHGATTSFRSLSNFHMGHSPIKLMRPHNSDHASEFKGLKQRPQAGLMAVGLNSRGRTMIMSSFDSREPGLCAGRHSDGRPIDVLNSNGRTEMMSSSNRGAPGLCAGRHSDGRPIDVKVRR
jgi:hypothetical protein